LHLGSLYTALAGFLQAKSSGGEWLLRIDDADTPRVAVGAVNSILHTLDRLGLHWDGPVVYQNREFPAYQAALDRLKAAGLLYACTCSRKTLASLPRLSPELPAAYPGTCRTASRARSEPHALRVIVGDAVVTLNDGLQGSKHWQLGREFGDFVVFRRDGIFAYHLATVIDDAKADVSEILRGRDLLESTPLQIYLQRVLNLPTPRYLHVPIIVDAQNVKLSKQNFAQAVDGGNPSPTLFALLALLHQSPPQELRGAPPAELLSWAIAAWDVSKLYGIASVAEPG
jgi:glutamyl-Q tRNA(Asp) synthetase